MTAQFKELTDLGLIAALQSKGYLPREKQKNGRRIVFIFETDQDFEDLCRSYFDHKMEVDAYEFALAIKSVKQVIYQLQQEGTKNA